MAGNWLNFDAEISPLKRLKILIMYNHLKSRGMNPDLYPGWGSDGDVARFPLRNFAGMMTGYIQYRPEGEKKAQNAEHGRYYTFITKGEIGVFGTESLHFSETIYLTGGMFKASTLHRLGFAALHVSSVSPKVLKHQLYILNRPYVAIGDNDDEGRTFARRFGGFTSPVDVDEMSDADVLEMLSKTSTR